MVIAESGKIKFPEIAGVLVISRDILITEPIIKGFLPVGLASIKNLLVAGSASGTTWATIPGITFPSSFMEIFVPILKLDRSYLSTKN
jgi:hypothetical protein